MLEATVQWRRTEKPECYDPDYISPEVSSTFATGILMTRSAGGGGGWRWLFGGRGNVAEITVVRCNLQTFFFFFFPLLSSTKHALLINNRLRPVKCISQVLIRRVDRFGLCGLDWKTLRTLTDKSSISSSVWSGLLDSCLRE